MAAPADCGISELLSDGPFAENLALLRGSRFGVQRFRGDGVMQNNRLSLVTIRLRRPKGLKECS